MTLVRSNPAGWALGDDFTSGQANSIDSQVASALDKSPAGDQLAGVITMAPGASIIATVAAGIQSSVGGGIVSTSPAGGIVLNGGSNDWPLLVPARARVYWAGEPIRLYGAAQSGWAISSNTFPGNPNTYYACLAGSATATQQPILLPQMHNGATLTNVAVDFIVGNGGQSGQPSPGPRLSVQRMGPLGLGTSSTVTLNNADGGVGLGPATIGLVVGQEQTFSYACNQNNVIDRSQYFYFALLTDQRGPSAVVGNIAYIFLQLTFSNIQNMQFP